jgi:hypothetical protein
MKISEVLPKLRPGAQWTLMGEEYAGLVWHDLVQAKPTEQEVTDGLAQYGTPEAILVDVRSAAVTELISDPSPSAKLVRAILLTALDEINVLRQRDVDNHADVANATTLADLKTRWAARAALGDRTATQLKTAVQNKITGGTVD